LLDTTLFNVSLPSAPTNAGKALILSGCRVVLDKNIPYSEFDELNYYSFNCNDYGYGRTDVELSFENIFKNPYSRFFVRCLAIRTNNAILCKIDQNIVPKISMIENYTKITKDGKVAIGIGYYFRSQHERDLLVNCSSFCVEGFFALGKKTKVYGFMCRIDQTDGGWCMSEGNTYQTYKHTNIKSLHN